MINEVHFLNPLEGWAIGDFTIRHTSDGGTTWDLQYEMNASLANFYRLGQVQFLDAQTGWVSGSNDGDTGYFTGILRTDDGGKTWRESAMQVTRSLSFTFSILKLASVSEGQRRQIIRVIWGSVVAEMVS